MRYFFFLAISFQVLALGCSPSESKNRVNPEREDSVDNLAPKSSQEVKRSSSSKGNASSDSTFNLTSILAGPYSVGSIGKFDIIIRPRGEYYINQKFPTSVMVKPLKALSLFKPKLEKNDAAQFTEQMVKFTVPFTSLEKGRHQVDAEVSFAVCTKKTCIPLRKPLSVKIEVQ